MATFLETIARDLGLLIQLPALLALPTLVIAALAGELFVLPGILAMAVLSLLSGQLLYRYGRGASETFPTLSLIVAALAWLIIALLGAIPFYCAAWLGSELSPTTLAFRDPLNALFEAMSGFTSTGLTMASDPSTLPMTLQWWRSLSEWVGGVGVIVFALAFVTFHEDGYELYTAEARSRQIGKNINTTVRRIWGIYLFYTVLTIIVYVTLGMPWWEALNHGLTGISTGGFAVTANSFGDYSASIRWATLGIICAGAITFRSHDALLRRGDWRFVLRQSQIRAFGVLLVSGTLLLVLVNRTLAPSTHIIDTIFQWVSALGTSGFSTVDLSTWNQPALLLLTVAMAVGATAGSTVGGLKLSRLTWLVKAVVWRLQRLWLQEGREPTYTFNGERKDFQEVFDQVHSAAVMALLWGAMIFLGSLILLLLMTPQYGLHEVLFEATSALSSVGLSVGITTPDLHPVGRLTLILLMWMGRLEILAVLTLLSAPFGMYLRSARRSVK